MSYREEVARVGITLETRDKLREMAKKQGVPLYQLIADLAGVTPPPPQPSAAELPLAEEAKELPLAEEAKELPLAETAKELPLAEAAEELPLATPQKDAPEAGAALELEKV